jgi:hypothetical protein
MDYVERMPKRSSNEPDLNQMAAAIVAHTTNDDSPASLNGKNPAAVALGKLGGLKGGKARAKSLSAKRRKQIARDAALRRWDRKP